MFAPWFFLRLLLLLLFNLLFSGDPLALVSLVRPFVPECRYADQLGSIVRVGDLPSKIEEVLRLTAIFVRTHRRSPPEAIPETWK